MKPTFFLTVAFVLPLGLAILPHTSAQAQTQPNREQVLQACAGDQIRTLPMPFVDVAPDHWAYDTVLKMYYCGPVRGSLATQELRKLQTQGSQLGEIAALPDANTLSSAQERVEIKGQQYRLETSILQNPLNEMTETRLTSTVILVATEDQEAVPASLKVDRLWLVKTDGEMWTTSLDSTATQSAANQIENISTTALGWEIGALVDVIVRLTDEENNTYFLKATEQPILQRN
ncbi:hypothetical protein [Microcoleus sp. FACHB-672]|uniref:hypothetical protein n=1 Tax=Microcoleus sp. FACHB-672 TaxID=2692825 RepID=UPI001687718A|nr:hypothetical protein [Microcoleus sp. FACHB-672]MBD2041830.1 hypothetical protein [Microcoleus sp. FACHB-672]